MISKIKQGKSRRNKKKNISRRLKSFLKVNNFKWVIKLLHLNKGNRYYFDFSNEDNTKISFLRDSCFEKIDLNDVYTDEVRKKYGIRSSIGKIIISSDSCVPSHLIARVQEAITLRANKINPFLVEISDKIKHYYLVDNYHADVGDLKNSCMKFEYCQDFLTFYENNGIKLAVILDENKRLLARALLWDKVIDLNTDEEIKYMDRAFAINAHYQNFLYEWARTNNIPSYSSICNNHSLLRKVSFDGLKFMPYLDTFAYGNVKLGFLSYNITSDNIHKVNSLVGDGGITHIFQSTKGEGLGNYRCKPRCCATCESDLTDNDYYHMPDGEISCGDCAVWSDWYDRAIYRDIAVWSHREDTYIEEDDSEFVWSEYENDYLCENSTVYLEYLNDYVDKNSSFIVYCESNGQHYLERDCIFCQYNDQWYHEDSEEIIFSELDNEYYPSDLVEYNEEHQSYTLREET
jgi:hypothetical protein